MEPMDIQTEIKSVTDDIWKFEMPMCNAIQFEPPIWNHVQHSVRDTVSKKVHSFVWDSIRISVLDNLQNRIKEYYE